MMATILNSSILNSAILDSSMLHKTLTKLVQSDSNSFILALLDDISHLEFCHNEFSYFAPKKNFTHSFWLNLMIAAILNSAMLDSDTAILDSDTLVSSLRFPQKHSHSILTLTQTNSIWLKLIHSHSNWWLQPSWILPSWIKPFCTKKKFTLSFWLNLMMAAILNSAILDSDTAILDSDHLGIFSQIPSKMDSHTIFRLWLKLIQSDSNSFILTQLDDCSHLEFCHHGFSHFAQKKLHSFILTQLDDCSYVEICHLGFSHFAQKELHSFILTQLDDAAILNSAIMDSAILHQKKNFTHLFWLNLMIAAILNSAMLDSDTAILDSDTLVSSLRFPQKHSHSILTLTETNSIWLKLIHSHSNWWLQSSWILPSWIKPFCTKKKFTLSFWLNLMMAAILNSPILDSDTAILDSDTLVSSLRFPQKHSHTIPTLTQTNSIWLKLIHSHSNWWLQPSWILPSWIQPFCTKKTSLVHCDSTWWLQLCWNLPSWIQPFCTKRTSLIHSHSTWWYQPSWILPSWIQLFCTKKKLHSFILTQLDDCSYVEICHLGFSHFAQKELHSFILTQLDDDSHLEFCHHGFIHFAPKKTSLIHSDSTWWLQPSWNLPCWFQTLPSWIQTPCYILSDTLKNTLPPLWLCLKLIPSD